MRIRNRLFPYPVLNNDKKLSDFNPDSEFELCFNDSVEIKDNDNFKLSDVCIQSNDSHLASLIKQGSIKGTLVVECSSSVFREKFELSFEPCDIIIPMEKFSGDVDISAFVYAAEDIDNYSSNSFLSDYVGSTFKIEKYCILAADDGFTVKVENQPENESKKASIFTITCDYNNDDDLVRYSVNKRKIVIYLTEKYYQYYNAIKNNDQFLNVSFATIAIPILSECILNVQLLFKQNPDLLLEDFCLECSWFRSVCNAYEREKGSALTNEQFREEIIPVELAQIVLNNASCNGISDIFGVVTGALIRKDDDE